MTKRLDTRTRLALAFGRQSPPDYSVSEDPNCQEVGCFYGRLSGLEATDGYCVGCEPSLQLPVCDRLDGLLRHDAYRAARTKLHTVFKRPAGRLLERGRVPPARAGGAPGGSDYAQFEDERFLLLPRMVGAVLKHDMVAPCMRTYLPRAANAPPVATPRRMYGSQRRTSGGRPGGVPDAVSLLQLRLEPSSADANATPAEPVSAGLMRGLVDRFARPNRRRPAARSGISQVPLAGPDDAVDGSSRPAASVARVGRGYDYANGSFLLTLSVAVQVHLPKRARRWGLHFSMAPAFEAELLARGGGEAPPPRSMQSVVALSGGEAFSLIARLVKREKTQSPIFLVVSTVVEVPESEFFDAGGRETVSALAQVLGDAALPVALLRIGAEPGSGPNEDKFKNEAERLFQTVGQNMCFMVSCTAEDRKAVRVTSVTRAVNSDKRLLVDWARAQVPHNDADALREKLRVPLSKVYARMMADLERFPTLDEKTLADFKRRGWPEGFSETCKQRLRAFIPRKAANPFAREDAETGIDEVLGDPADFVKWM